MLSGVREVEVDWQALYNAFQMNSPEVSCYLCVADGSVIRVPPGDPRAPEVRRASQEYVRIEAVPSRIQYQWVDEFARTVDDPELRERIEAAINGKGAFRRFKDLLLSIPDERRRWFEFRDQKMRVRIVEWVQEKALLATNPPPWDAGGHQHEDVASTREAIDALRDYLIAWAEDQGDKATQPLTLEKLAEAIGERFVIRQKS